MSQIITAVYEQGLLHPAVPLNLQEHERVCIHVLPEKPVDKTEQIIDFLVQSAVGFGVRVASVFFQRLIRKYSLLFQPIIA